MAIDKIDNDTKMYTDIQGLEQLHTQLKNNPNAAKKQVAQQFEALLVQMMMKSMRDANKTFASDLLNGNEMDFYQEMFDKQLSLSLSNHGLGIADMIEKNIDAHQAPALSTPVETLPSNTLREPVPNTLAFHPITTVTPPKITAQVSSPVSRKEDKASFIQAIWSGAKLAARALGTHPSILVAQAALETDWGKKMLNHNLFNIKADSQWKKASTTVASLENKNGVLVKEKSNFRAYDSIHESLQDYVQFLKTHQRYSDALTKTSDPSAYINALQTAGYATDKDYAQKVMKIHESPDFKKMLVGLK